MLRYFFYSIIVVVALNFSDFIISRWVGIPTELEWELQQKVEIDSMLPGIEQFEAVRKLEHINFQSYYVEAAKVEFAELIQKYGSFANQLDIWHGNQFYPLLREYLESVDENQLVIHCTQDPWNVVFTPISVQRYPDEISICDFILP